MIAQGTDGLLQGVLLEGVMTGEDMLSFVDLAMGAIERQTSLLMFIQLRVGKALNWDAKFAGSRRVLATVVDKWLENLLALAPVRAYAYVQQYHNL
jgi:hypothetical protein